MVWLDKGYFQVFLEGEKICCVKFGELFPEIHAKFEDFFHINFDNMHHLFCFDYFLYEIVSNNKCLLLVANFVGVNFVFDNFLEEELFEF